jgi:3-hydroxyisobutyrate dehydrogenase-like beta-hydroxyacid dehydrogenase
MGERVGFVGLGQMSAPMAANLLRAGFELSVYNRTAGKARPLADQGASVRATAAEAVPSPDGLVVTMLADDAALHPG